MKYTLLLLVLFFSILGFSQKNLDKAYDRMAKSVCECAKNKDLDFQNTDKAAIELAFGVCIIQAYGEDTDYYKKNGITLTTDNYNMEELGEQIGIKMANYCPDMLLVMASLYENDWEEDDAIAVQERLNISGNIERVEQGSFSTIIIKGDDGKTYKMLWLTYVNNHDLLLEAVKNNKKYIFTYYETEMFDNRINEYRNMLVLNAIE